MMMEFGKEHHSDIISWASAAWRIPSWVNDYFREQFRSTCEETPDG